MEDPLLQVKNLFSDFSTLDVSFNNFPSIAENSDVWRRLSEAWLLQGDGQQAMGAAVRAIQLDPLSSGAVLILARALAQVM